MIFDAGRSVGTMPELRETKQVTISVVVPLFNESENLAELYRRIKSVLESENSSYEIIFINDGSSDSTPRLLDALSASDERLVVLHLSRNFGHQAAVTAGLDHAVGDAVIVMDGDLQDPPEVLPQFIAKWREGFDVVYAVRTKRKEWWPKRACYFVFYRVLHMIGDLEIPLDSGDFSLLDRDVVEALSSLPEHRRFVRGLRTFVGFRQVGLPYERAAREAGNPKYTFRALTGLAVDGLVSFSSYPLRLVTYLGLLITLFASILMVWVFIDAIVQQTAPQGWASLLAVVLFLGAVQLISLGIIGEYIRLIFLETKHRPTYILKSRSSRKHRQSNESGSVD